MNEVQQRFGSMIEEKMRELDHDSVRYKALLCLLKMKSSWVELGRILTDIAYGGDYKEWGYEDFEMYCAREMGLKKPTVKKLMVSYNYMKSYAPERLEKTVTDTGYDVPESETVSLLKKVREIDTISEQEKEELHRMAFEGNTEESILRKEIKSRLQAPTLNDDIEDSNAIRREEIKWIVRTSRTMRQRIHSAKSIPAAMKERVAQALTELEALD